MRARGSSTNNELYLLGHTKQPTSQVVQAARFYNIMGGILCHRNYDQLGRELFPGSSVMMSCMHIMMT